MKTLFTCILFLLLLISCGKERTIQIKAINAATGQPYAGLEYRIASSRTTAGGEKYDTEASGTLDANGEAIEHIKQRKGRTYSVRVVELTNTCYNKLITQYFDSQYDDNGKFTFEFAECAYMKQNIVNVNCQGATDVFNIRDRFTYTEWSGWSVDLVGCYSNTGGDYFKVPAGKRYFQWKVTRPSGVTEHIDSIYLAPGEYGDLNIHY